MEMRERERREFERVMEIRELERREMERERFERAQREAIGMCEILLYSKDFEHMSLSISTANFVFVIKVTIDLSFLIDK